MTAPSTTRPIHQPGGAAHRAGQDAFGMTAGCVCCSFVGPGSTRGAAYCRSNSAPQSGQRTAASSISFPHFGHIIRAHPFREQTSAQDRVLTGEQAGLCSTANTMAPSIMALSAMAAIHQIAVRLPPRPTGTVFRMTFVGVKEDFVLPPVIMTGEYCTSSSTPQSGHRQRPFEVLSAFRTHHRNPFLSAEQGVRCENPFHTNLHLQYSRVPRKYNSLSE